MLQNIKELYGYQLAASDGPIGHVKDFYFDDQAWAVRYLVVDTGTWLTNRPVLLSPHAFGRLDQDGKTIHVSLTRNQIENSPSPDTHKPVSRQYEEEYYRYYGWSTYWQGGGMWGLSGFPVVTAPVLQEAQPIRTATQPVDPHLRSTKALAGYHVQATDGDVGSVNSFLVDDKSWAVNGLVVDTGHWFTEKDILLSPEKIKQISYAESKVFVRLPMADIKRMAEYDLKKTRA